MGDKKYPDDIDGLYKWANYTYQKNMHVDVDQSFQKAFKLLPKFPALPKDINDLEIPDPTKRIKNLDFFDFTDISSYLKDTSVIIQKVIENNGRVLQLVTRLSLLHVYPFNDKNPMRNKVLVVDYLKRLNEIGKLKGIVQILDHNRREPVVYEIEPGYDGEELVKFSDALLEMIGKSSNQLAIQLTTFDSMEDRNKVMDLVVNAEYDQEVEIPEYNVREYDRGKYVIAKEKYTSVAPKLIPYPYKEITSTELDALDIDTIITYLKRMFARHDFQNTLPYLSKLSSFLPDMPELEGIGRKGFEDFGIFQLGSDLSGDAEKFNKNIGTIEKLFKIIPLISDSDATTTEKNLMMKGYSKVYDLFYAAEVIKEKISQLEPNEYDEISEKIKGVFYFVRAIGESAAAGNSHGSFIDNDYWKSYPIVRTESTASLAKEESNRLAKEQADRLAKEQADRLAKEQADRLAKEQADRLAKEQADRLAKEQADRLAKEQANRLAKEQADRLAKEQANRLAKEQADRLAKLTKKDENPVSDQYAKIALTSIPLVFAMPTDKNPNIASHLRSMSAKLKESDDGLYIAFSDTLNTIINLNDHVSSIAKIKAKSSDLQKQIKDCESRLEKETENRKKLSRLQAKYEEEIQKSRTLQHLTEQLRIAVNNLNTLIATPTANSVALTKTIEEKLNEIRNDLKECENEKAILENNRKALETEIKNTIDDIVSNRNKSAKDNDVIQYAINAFGNGTSDDLYRKIKQRKDMADFFEYIAVKLGKRSTIEDVIANARNNILFNGRVILQELESMSDNTERWRIINERLVEYGKVNDIDVNLDTNLIGAFCEVKECDTPTNSFEALQQMYQKLATISQDETMLNAFNAYLNVLAATPYVTQNAYALANSIPGMTLESAKAYTLFMLAYNALQDHD